MLSVLLIMAQLSNVTPGQPPTQLRFVHLDRNAAVYVDDAATAPDPSQEGATRTRSLRVPFTAEDAPYWIIERHDCTTRQTQAIWRRDANPDLQGGPHVIPGSAQDWAADLDPAGAAVGSDVCGATQRPADAGTPMTPDEALRQANDLPLETRFEPDLYTRYGDLGHSLAFLGMDQRYVGWFVEPRSARPDEGGAVVDALEINGRSSADGGRVTWRRLHFDCEGQMRTLKGQRYADGPRALATVPPETTDTPIEPDSMMSRVQRYACAPRVRTVNGLNSAIAGIVAHVAAVDAAGRN